MSETMYMTSDPKNNTGSSVTSSKINGLEDPAFISTDRDNDNVATTFEHNLFQENKSYVTDLGYSIDKNKKLTLRDLGRHMTERMLQSMSQERINANFSSLELGAPGMGKDDPVSNIFKHFFTSDANQESEYVDVSQLLAIPPDKFGDYMSDIDEYSDYAKKCSGIAAGESNVLNPPFMFNELDDVRSDFRRPQLGRIYSEEIYDYNMPIVYFQPGLVSISSAGIKFLSDTVNKKTEKYQQYLRGDSSAIKWGASKIGAGITSILSFGAKTILDKAQWWKWTPDITKYMKMVDEMLIELATWMGLIGGKPDGDNAENAVFNAKAGKDIEAMANYNTDEFLEKANKMDDAFDSNNPLTSGPDNSEAYLAQGDPNGVIVEAKSGYMGGDGTLSALGFLPGKKTLLKRSGAFSDSGNEDSTARKIKDYVETAVPFAMDKGAQSSETFSNSTQTHPIAEQYNQMYEDSNQISMAGTAGLTGGASDAVNMGVDSTIESLRDYGINKLKSGANNFLANIGLSSEAGMVAAGLGRFMLPEVWTDSTFDKSYSISMKLRSPYGHRLSIFENCFVPLAFLMGFSAPRKIGIQSYTNPFYIRAFAKGLFAVPMGMITSLSISRGEDNNDRTVEGFFRTINVNISIKDMLPNMAVGIDGGELSLLNASNMGMHNYLLTLCGIDFIDRANYLEILSHKFDKITNGVRKYDIRSDTGKSNLMFGLSNNPVGRFVGKLSKSVGMTQNQFATNTPNKFY